VHKEGFETALGASYRLESRLGQGATGEVWKAVDRRGDEVVAAKLLRQEHVADQDLVSRFLRERAILTGLRHTNLVAIRDLVVEGERLAIVMDYVDGGSLRDVLVHRGPLPPAQAVDLAAAVLDGLAAAHDKGVLHRDIKPDNVLLARDWHDVKPGDVKLTDFGIARIVADGVRTTTGLLGTPEYMSPELIATGGADLPADVYGIGILLYELLAGRTPFAGPGTDYTIAHRHVTSEPPALPVPDPLWDVVADMLAKDPGRRPNARDAAVRLRRLRPSLGGVPALERQSPPEGFESSQGPATVVRGVAPGPEAAPDADADPDETARSDGGAWSLDDLDLGAPGQATVVRPMERPVVAREQAPRVATVERKQKTSAWRDPKVLGMVAAALVLLGAGVWWAMAGGEDEAPTGGGATGPVSADQGDTALPTGLTVRREATWDPDTETVDLTITYGAQTAPLTGPFLEVIPAADGSTCPTAQWTTGEQRLNLPSATAITTPCAWSIETPPIPAQGSASVNAQLPLALPEGEDPAAALQEWLDGVSAATLTAVGDGQVQSTAYPAQRMQGLQVVAPASTVSGRILPLKVLPVWPSGADELNPIYRSPSVEEPSSMLTAIAGGEQGVRFSDGCGGALTVQNGLVVTALSQTPECTVNASIGNFTDLQSTSFAIVTRGR